MSLRQHTGMELHAPEEPIPILYLDDDLDDATALGTQLSPSIINPVVCFSHAHELYDYLDAHTGPFIILVDLVLMNEPGHGGGYEVITNLKGRSDVTDTLPPSAVIAVTGTRADTFLEERARRTGAAGLIIKPVRVQDLVEVGLGKPGFFRVQLSR